MTSQFIRHHPCTACGSKDNLAEYTNSWYCFGCGYYKKKTDLNSLRERVSKGLSNDRVGYPLNSTEKIPPRARKWLLEYNITDEEINPPEAILNLTKKSIQQYKSLFTQKNGAFQREEQLN